jgi:hypothetical protein
MFNLLAGIVDGIHESYLSTTVLACSRPNEEEGTCYGSDSETPCRHCRVSILFSQLYLLLKSLRTEPLCLVCDHYIDPRESYVVQDCIDGKERPIHGRCKMLLLKAEA